MTSSAFNIILCLLVATPAMLQAVKLQIQPAHQHVRRDTGTASVTCRLTDSDGQPRPITACRVVVQERYSGKTRSELDLSRGSSSQLPDRYNYNGQGLEGGDCGLAIKPPHDSWHVYLVSCRVRKTGEPRWIYSAEALISITPYKDLPFVVPRHVFALPGSRVDITTRADGGSLRSCAFMLAPRYTRIDLSSGAGSADNRPEHRYIGRGMPQGDCGISLLVSADSSGHVVSHIHHKRDGRTDYVGFRYTALIVTTPPENITLTINNQPTKDDAILSATCRVTNSRPVAKITWLLGDVVIRHDEVNEEPDTDAWITQYDLQTIKQTLTRNVTAADSGKKLVCRVYQVALPGGTTERNTVDPVFKSKPDLISSGPLMREVTEGDSLLLEVVSKGCSCDISYSWTKDGVNITSHGYPVLNIKRLLKQDSGVYKCTAVNAAGSATVSFNVTVLYKPVFSTPASDYRVLTEGDKLNVEVLATGNPSDIAYIWTKEGSNNPLPAGRILSINSVSAGDAGVYQCTAFNSVGSATTRVNVLVLHKPVFESQATKELTLNEGETLLIEVLAKAFPSNVEYTWIKEGDSILLPAGPVLTILDMRSQHGGIYTCKATNSLGAASVSFKVTVKHKPVIEFPTAPVWSVTQGDTLRVEARGKPADIVFKWVKMGSTKMLPAGPLLLINNVHLEDAGVYLLTAVNSLGSETVGVYVSVLISGKPVFYSPVNNDWTITEGEDLLITVAARGDPPHITYTWIKEGDNTKLPAGPVLAINEVCREDAGIYKSTAVNAAGSATVSFNVTIYPIN